MRWRYMLAPEGTQDPGFDTVVETLDGIDLTAQLVSDPSAHLVLNRRTQKHISSWISVHSPMRRA